MKYIQLLAFVVLTVSTTKAFQIEKWHQFKLEHDKIYNSFEEEAYRLQVFRDNLQKITRHNLLYSLGFHTYRMGVNQFTDLTSSEFMGLYTSKIEYLGLLQNNSIEMEDPDDTYLPNSMDWRTRGAVTRVKFQKHCSSCWAFSTTGAIEGQWFRKTGKLVSLSEQNLVDCTGSGCRPSDTITATRYVIRNGGIDTEASYPYQGVVKQCRYRKAHKGASVKNIRTFQGENQLKNFVANVGPISAWLVAAPIFQHYNGGVFYDASCSRAGQNYNHLVLIVGYGTENGQNYWLMKNSWGTTWGEAGYMKILMDRGTCGIGQFFSYPIV